MARAQDDPVPQAPPPRLVVPAYFHPAVHPGDWEWLAGHAERVRLVILNVRNGPGVNFDPPVGLLSPNAVVTIFSEKNGWGEIASNRWIRLGPTYNVKVDGS